MPGCAVLPMEVNVNGKLSIASTAVMLSCSTLVLLMMASSVVAQPITVDGDGSDWDPSWFLAADPLPDTDPVSGSVVNCGNAGYNLTGVWQNYNATEDKLYFMYNVTGTAGDSDGDGDPNNGSTWWNDQYGVGDSEEYVLMINTSPTGDPYNYSDIFLKFKGNSATVTGPKAHLVSSVEAAINTTNFTSFVEFSVGNVTGWVANPYKYSLYGYAGSAIDFANEDWLGEVLYVTFPPVANFTFVAGVCNQTVRFNPSGSYDDPYGGIVNYTWDFGDGTPVDVRLDNSSFSHTFPVTNGTYNVSLTVIDTDNLTDTFVDMVPVNREPSISLVNASKTSVVEPGEWVLFQGWYSDPDEDTLMHRWSIDGVEIASGSSTNYSNASYFVNRTLTANLTISDPNDCTNTSSVNVTYLYRPVPVINFTATGCLRVELNASGSYDPDGNITDYLWHAENGTIDNSTNATCTANFSVGGNYTVRLNVTDNDGLTNTTTREICISCVPTAVAEVNRTNVTEPGGWVLFDGSNSICDTTCDTGNSLSYSWNITDGNGSIIDHNASVLRNVTSNTTAVLNVTDEYGCTNTSSVNVTYLHLPVPVINFTAIGCLEVELNASNSSDHDGYIKKYEWDLNNNSVYGDMDDATGVNCTVNFSDGGNHTIGLRVTDNSNLTNSTRQVVYVSCVPTAAARANRTNVTAPGEMVLFDAPNSTCDMNVTNSLNYTWVIHGKTYNDSSGEGVLYFVTNTTTANLTVTDEYNCTATDDVTVGYQYPPIVPVINFTTIGCLEVELNASGSYDPDGNITKYEWDLDNDTYYDDAVNVTCTANFSDGGNHTIGVRVTDDDGLTNSTRRTIYVASEPVAVAEANQTNVIPPGGWVLFNGSNSTYDLDSGPLSYRWNISGYIDHNVSVSYYVHEEVTADLTVTDRYNCTNTTSVTVTAHKVGDPVAVPVMTPVGALALGILLCVVGMSRIAKRRS